MKYVAPVAEITLVETADVLSASNPNKDNDMGFGDDL